MKLGIVGLPNVGKSTLFNAITSTKNAEAANYPFCTIEPNSGIVAVPDKRLDKLAEIWQTNKKDTCHRGVCRHRRSGQGCQPGCLAWATSSWAISASVMPSCMWCAALMTTTSSMWWRT